MIRTGLIATLLTITALPAAAQQMGSHRLADAQAPKFQVPLCSLKGGGKPFDRGQKALRKAIEEKDTTKRQEQFSEAYAQLTTAVTEDPNNPAHWYYLARAYLYFGDVAGTDSAFTRTLAMAPSCELDVTQHRQNGWAVLANAGLTFVKAGNPDSALVMFRLATKLFRDLPHVFTNMGVIFANNGTSDSAAIYFAEAAEVAGRDTAYTADRDAATLNLAVMYQRLERYPESIATLRQYLGWNPDDMDAQRSLGQAFRSAGMVDSADAMEARIVSALSAMHTDSLDTADLMAVGVGYFRAQKFAEAAGAFESIVARVPFSRDGNYNLANTYLAMEEWEKLGTVANQLLTIDPMNVDALQLLGQSQRSLKQNEALFATAEKIVGLPWTFEVTGFQIGASSSHLTANLVGRTPMDASGASIEVPPITLVLEFLDANGAVLDTKEVTIPKVEPGAIEAFQAETKKAGVAGWRYHRK